MDPSANVFRKVVMVATSALLAVSLVGCSAATNAENSISKSAEEFRVVSTSLGEVQVPAEIERVVVLNIQQASMVMSLGVTPVAVAGLADPYPWLDDTVVPLIDESLQDAALVISPEAVAVHNPDVIFIGGWQLTDPELVTRLQRIAPVVSTDSTEVVPSWQDALQTIGDTLDLRSEADDMIANIEGDYRDLGERAGVVGLTYQFPTLHQNLFGFGNGTILQLTGMVPGAHQDIDGAISAHEISLEQAPELSPDLLLLLRYTEQDNVDLPGFEQLPSVQAGNYYELSEPEAVALLTPEPIGLSGYLLDFLEPKLEALGKTKTGQSSDLSEIG